MAQPSPYTPGEIARPVPGRAQHRHRLTTLVPPGCNASWAASGSTTAPEGWGKTPLLRKAQRDANRLGCATEWVTAGESAGLVPAIAEEIERLSPRLRSRQSHAPGPQGPRANRGDGRRRSPRRCLARGDVARTRRHCTAPSPASHDVAVRGPHRHRRRRRRDQGRSGLILFVDEVQSADPDGLRTFS